MIEHHTETNRSPVTAAELLSSALRDDDRVLVLGAGGWFGATLLDLLPDLPPERVKAIASFARDQFVGTRNWRLEAWSGDTVRGFSPTVVANLAFLARERVATEGEEQFTSVNRELTQRFLDCLDLPDVRAAVTVSSGAAITEPNHPYGRLKGVEERAALARVRPGLGVVVGRAWSLSGVHVRRPQDFAFSNFALQARTGSVEVQDPRHVFRRYVDVGDFLSVCLHSALDGWSGIIDSGGELVELSDLAAMVAKAIEPQAVVRLPPIASDEVSAYASDDASWTRACSALEFKPLSLDQQIARVVRTLPTV